MAVEVKLKLKVASLASGPAKGLLPLWSVPTSGGASLTMT